MSHTPRILAFAGSTRRDSANKKLARAAAHAAVAAHASVTWIDLRDYPLPLFDADLEVQGLPPAMLRLRALFAQHEALIVASPEYNGFFPPVLKNALDWLSRPALGQERHAVFAGRPVLLLSAVAGRSGGTAGLQQLRQQFLNLKALPYGRQFVLPLAADAFDARNRVGDPARRAELADTVAGFALSLHALAPA
ncbi:NADPH-dependent FMN reductase [Massilia niastensis]|uniref:NADPH-dependent FMN reductase n=1 Tax=Massilia niastensis TaxID=544911 RepID=UPI0003737EB8|nr:NAD(P)H-dependent oxidoreductase [Massilia niastensis]